ncbi:hypothetical protein T265_03049 [Opisthorchis viverrini]|uniref:Uncharacterized protein n=1 Tax=Opisthorchis viverrini TaxID=6198 RepID=A0A074ZTX9_OPIVI|nr:hypothetical protein T265_03049 [Opisthorchis viverrini]KER30571.1 hypothetical protein T265_03049 [Opisthorchis viverrini]
MKADMKRPHKFHHVTRVRNRKEYWYLKLVATNISSPVWVSGSVFRLEVPLLITPSYFQSQRTPTPPRLILKLLRPDCPAQGTSIWPCLKFDGPDRTKQGPLEVEYASDSLRIPMKFPG